MCIAIVRPQSNLADAPQGMDVHVAHSGYSRPEADKSDSCTWPLPSSVAKPTSGEVHIWCAHLAVDQATLTGLQGTLSRDERVRSMRYYFRADRIRFVAVRGMLRVLLGYYLGKSPQEVHFGYGLHGKPYLETPSGRHSMRFNLSYSGSFAVYAIACGREVGIDIERVSEKVDTRSVAESFFAEIEVEALAHHSAGERTQAFFRLWTRKEALLKASGQGILDSLDLFDATLTFPKARHPLWLEQGGAGSTLWSVEDLAPAPGYTAAIVTPGPGWITKTWRLMVSSGLRPTFCESHSRCSIGHRMAR